MLLLSLLKLPDFAKRSLFNPVCIFLLLLHYDLFSPLLYKNCRLFMLCFTPQHSLSSAAPPLSFCTFHFSLHNLFWRKRVGFDHCWACVTDKWAPLLQLKLLFYWCHWLKNPWWCHSEQDFMFLPLTLAQRFWFPGFEHALKTLMWLRRQFSETASSLLHQRGLWFSWRLREVYTMARDLSSSSPGAFFVPAVVNSLHHKGRVQHTISVALSCPRDGCLSQIDHCNNSSATVELQSSMWFGLQRSPVMGKTSLLVRADAEKSLCAQLWWYFERASGSKIRLTFFWCRLSFYWRVHNYLQGSETEVYCVLSLKH